MLTQLSYKDRWEGNTGEFGFSATWDYAEVHCTSRKLSKIGFQTIETSVEHAPGVLDICLQKSGCHVECQVAGCGTIRIVLWSIVHAGAREPYWHKRFFPETRTKYLKEKWMNKKYML